MNDENEDDSQFEGFAMNFSALPPELQAILRNLTENGEHAAILDPNDMPNEIKEMIQQRLGLTPQSKFSDEIVDKVMPSKAQLAAGPGDKVAVSGGEEGTGTVDEMVVGTILDASEHTEEFPDWEEQLHNGYVLLSYRSSLEPESTEVGWFSRLGLVTFNEDWMWYEYEKFMNEGSMEPMTTNPPAWFVANAVENATGVFENNPEMMERFGKNVTCERCKSKAVLLEGKRSGTWRWMVAEQESTDEEDPRPVLTSFGVFDKSSENSAVLICTECGHHQDVWESHHLHVKIEED